MMGIERKFKRSFPRLWIGVLFVSLILSIRCGLLKNDESFRFVFMTDIHVQPELRGAEGFESAIDHVNGLMPKPAFAITGGDLVMDVLSQTYGRADSLYTLFQQTAQRFEMPVHNCIGNHEHFGLSSKSGVSPDHPEYGKRMFMNRLGEGRTYRSFDHGKWHFILLDGVGMLPERGYFGQVDSLQLVWLKEDLERIGPDRPVVLALHIPLYSVRIQFRDGPLASNGRGSVVTNANDVWKICRQYNVKLVLQGHLHIVEEIVWRGTHFVNAGAVSGAWWKGPNEDFEEGFVVVDVKGDDFTWRYEPYGWNAEN